jgi:PAS domain S-box-containing protein
MVDITDQKAAEQRVREAEERHRALVEHIPAIVYAEGLDASPEDLYVSPQVERILGYTPDQWRQTADFWKQHVHPDDLAGVIEINDRVNESGATFLAEYRFRAADGAYRWLRDEAVRVLDDDGLPLFWQGVMLDITDQKRAQQDLREADERYRAVVEHIPAVVYTEAPDADPAKFYISPQVTDLFGYTAEEWTWTTDFWRDRIHPDDAETVVAVDERSNETLEAYTLDYRFRHRDGHWVWVRDEATFVPELDGEGFWQGFMLDITERKRAEDQLREAELKFRTIVEQNQAIFYTQEIDPETGISQTNYIAPGNTDLIGYPVEDVLADSKLWSKIIHPDDRARVLDADRQSNLGEIGEHFSQEYRMIRKDGRVVWVQDEARLVQIGDAAPYWQGFLLEITERKEAEERLGEALEREREATQRLRSLDEMKNTFLQAVSHDLRTPLAAILGLAITLERTDVELDEGDTQDLARRIADNARKLDRLVMNLLDLDRLARGIVEPKLHVSDLGSLVRRALSESDLLTDARVETDIAEVVMPIDGAKVERIVENLLANTARHTPRGTTVWVRVRRVPEGGMILVEDDGPGVPPELREEIFEPFRQGPDAPQHSPGVGVGLALVRRFAELHGGRAWVEGREGGGASFRVLLPMPPGWLGTPS